MGHVSILADGHVHVNNEKPTYSPHHSLDPYEFVAPPPTKMVRRGGSNEKNFLKLK